MYVHGHGRVPPFNSTIHFIQHNWCEKILLIKHYVPRNVVMSILIMWYFVLAMQLTNNLPCAYFTLGNGLSLTWKCTWKCTGNNEIYMIQISQYRKSLIYRWFVHCHWNVFIDAVEIHSIHLVTHSCWKGTHCIDNHCGCRWPSTRWH